MGFGFLNLLMLIGLAGVAIPIIIHLLNRRRFDVVDWGAMQFLHISETTRRRLLIEELLLLLLRMGLIAVLVLALAAPYVESAALARLGGGNRDVVLLIDGSASMGYTGTGRSPHETAREAALAFVNSLAAGDSVAVLQAKEQVVPIVGALTHDLERVRDGLTQLREPSGGCNWPAALQAAQKLLAGSQRPRRDIILLSDNQRFGWADDSTLLRWELLGQSLGDATGPRPEVWVVNLAPGRPAAPPNWSLAPLRASRALASVGQQVILRTALEIRGQEAYRPPHALRVEVDGKAVLTDLKAPATAQLEKGQVPLTFHHRFTTPGSHLVSVIVEPDPPPAERPAGYVVKDHLPGDNRQDLAVEVLPALPVLLVDGGDRFAATRRSTDFLGDALAPARDLTPVVAARVVPFEDLDTALLQADVSKEPGSRPRVLILADVPRLTSEQQEAVASFLDAGGGVLVTLGERAEARAYNDDLYRGGQGWLPARLEEVAGDETRPEQAPGPLPTSFFHPALDLFREVPVGGLGAARFPRWWKLATPGRSSPSVPIGLLTSNDPFLVEKPYRNGRVIVAAAPLDKSWRTNLPELPAFVPLVHELVYYLAGTRAAEHNLAAGQPIRYRAESEAALAPLTLQPPMGEARTLRFEDVTDAGAYPAQLVRQPHGVLVVYEGTRETGVYRLTTAGDQTVYYVVQSDPRESDLTPAGDDDRARVARLVPMSYETDLESLQTALAQTTQRQEVWWWLLLGVIGLLCAEVWMTRRMVLSRG
jgi:hypothetical protein